MVILSGKDKGKQGKVLQVSPKEGKVIVEGCNMVTKHVKPRQMGEALSLIHIFIHILAILKHTPKSASEPLQKLLKSAMANAENNHNMDKNSLYVAECFVCPGPTLKRIRPRAQGRAFHVLKRTSHVTMVLKEKE